MLQIEGVCALAAAGADPRGLLVPFTTPLRLALLSAPEAQGPFAALVNATTFRSYGDEAPPPRSFEKTMKIRNYL